MNLSPDGRQMAYAKSSQDLKAHTSSSNIFVMTLADKTARQLTTSNHCYAPSWSTDGRQLYYTAVDSSLTQVHRIDLVSGKDMQVTHFELGVQSPKVSPDGKLIAFTAKVYPEAGADGKLNAELAKKKQQGPIHAHLADSLLFRHWTSYNDGTFTHIIVYNMETGTYTDVTPGNFQSPVFSPSGDDDGFCFSPDSKEICFVSNRSPHQEANTNADLWTVPVTGGEATNITAANKAWDGTPQYSPDGRYIAYRMQKVEGYESDRFRLALYNRQSKETTVLTEPLDNWVDSYRWDSSSRNIYFLVEERGYQPLYVLNLKTKKYKKMIADRAIGSFELGKGGQIVYTYSRTEKPSAVYIMKNGREEQLTHLNDKLEQETDIRPSEAFWVKGADGDSVEYFVVKPHNFDASKKYPVVINVHGGPQMQWMNSFRPDWQVYPGAGYVVVYPNPHGSTGYGQAFTLAISKNWGTKPFEDVMKVTDAVEQLPYVDKDRIGAMGWSYGGYFMNWLQGQTRRYKCLASMMGLYDLNSMWGTTEELWFPNFDLDGQPWNSPLYRKFSPSEYTRNFGTPALIITGERDFRVSYNQSLAYFTTLQTLGIPSRLIIYDNDGHWPSSTSMLVYYNAHLEWFHKYLGGEPAPWNTEKMINNQQEYTDSATK
jgi:dipeptidyl aminopeptidase/acylaminoacyl peptidase